MVDSVRGSIRIRAWPRKRPGRRHPDNEYWSKWLKAVTYLYRYQPAVVQSQLQAATKGTIWMPRDIFISAVRARAWSLTDENRRTYHPMAFRIDVSESLDAIAQIPGELLFRGPELWLPVPGGSPGYLLSYVDDSTPPEWIPAPSGAYQVVRPIGGNLLQPTTNVNSLTYITNTAMTWSFSCDDLSFNQFRIMAYGQANQAGQTVTLQLAQSGSPTVPLSAAGNDLVVPVGTAWHDSGWKTVPTPLTGMRTLCIAAKGSNATVDILTLTLECHLRKV